MPMVVPSKLKVGDLVTVEESEARIRSLWESSEDLEWRVATFFDYPGEVTFREKVMRTGHQPLNKAEMSNSTNVDVSASPEQQISAPTPVIMPQTHVEPVKSVDSDVLLAPLGALETEPRTSIAEMFHQPSTTRVDLPKEDISIVSEVVTEIPKARPTSVPTIQMAVQESSATGTRSQTSIDPVEQSGAASKADTPSSSSGDRKKYTDPVFINIRTGADRVAYAFYGAAALSAVVGSALGAVSLIEWPVWLSKELQYVIASVPVAVVELGGAVSAALGDQRRQLGERAIGYRAMSGGIAAAAIAWQLFSHHFMWYGWAFAGLSVIAYTLYLLHSAAKRRDALRSSRKMANLAPVYPLWQQIRHPQIVRLAKSLVQEDETLGIFEALRMAREELATQHRHEMIAKALKRAYKEAYKDSATGREVILATMDLERLAAKVEGNADYEGWAAVISSKLAPRELEG
jgi:hypothetical protein